MTVQTANLWPTDFGEPAILTPVAILRQQGSALGDKTRNIVVGRVQTVAGPGSQIEHSFRLWCSPLGYEYLLLWVRHDLVELYPVEIAIRDGETISAPDPDSLMNALKDIFARPQTVKVIASMLAQSRS